LFKVSYKVDLAQIVRVKLHEDPKTTANTLSGTLRRADQPRRAEKARAGERRPTKANEACANNL